jgi:nicotinate-nucleotide adenylyltransferase
MFTPLKDWRSFKEISELAVLCACARDKNELSKLKNYACMLEREYGSECVVEDIPVDKVSSTEIRKKLSCREDVSELVDPGVLDFIVRKGLYKNKCERSDFSMQGIYDAKIPFFKDLLEKALTPKRFYHTCCVSNEAVKLAKLYDGDVEKARFAGLVHDITKDNSKEEQLRIVEKYSIILDKVEAYSPKLLHAITGAAVLKYEHNITDSDILNAVRYHTTARAGMSLREKISYLADYISADRDYEGVDKLRVKIYESMQKGMEEALDYSICEVVEKHAPVHIDTVKARNELILSK